MRVHYRGKLFDQNFGFNDSKRADIYGYIRAKGRVIKKNSGLKIPYGPWFTIYFNNGSRFDLEDITQKSKADVVVEGIIAFIQTYKGQASIILRTDSRKAFEHLATPFASLKRWNLKVSPSYRAIFDKHSHIVGLTYECPSVVKRSINRVK